jgi:PhoH-like ATPase
MEEANMPPQTSSSNVIPMPRTEVIGNSQAVAKDPHLMTLDTSVLIAEPPSIFRFQENHINIPPVVFDELDHLKNSSTEVGRNAREVGRILETILSGWEGDLKDGVPLSKASGGIASGKLYLQENGTSGKSPRRHTTADDQIIQMVRKLSETVERNPKKNKYGVRDVILVTKDTFLRLRAQSQKLKAQDYRNDRVIDDADMLRTGLHTLGDDFWETHETKNSWHENGHEYYEVTGPTCNTWLIHEGLIVGRSKKNGDPFFGMVVGRPEEDRAIFRTITNYMSKQNKVWECNARNQKQSFVLNLLMDPEIDFVTILGQAGTGKTILTLAAGMFQVVETKRYSKIVVIGAAIPVGKDEGFLPGNERMKIAPWMGGIQDNMEVLGDFAQKSHRWNDAKTQEFLRQIELKSLNYVRGRSMYQVYLIVDEAQNLTPHQARTIATRAGAGTKVVFLGNLGQIDTPYLTEASSGLTFIVEGFKEYPFGGHVILTDCERSRLTSYAIAAL